MMKIIIQISSSFLLSAIFLSSYASEDSSHKENTEVTRNADNQTTDSLKESDWAHTWNAIKGEKAHNALLFEMFTLHVNPDSLKTRNWHQKMLAIQYEGIFAGTFINSFYNRTYTLGLARKVYHTQSDSKHWGLDVGYRIGALYGYEPGQAPLSSGSPVIPFIQAFAAISYRNTFGIEFNIVADPSVVLFLYF